MKKIQRKIISFTAALGMAAAAFNAFPCLRAEAAGLVPAFPGAEGGGMYATGGRGGTVYHVTNLNSSGAGSFRDAVSASNRIVVFDVGGTIDLGNNDLIVKGNITVAGQTAPGGHGITVKNGKIGMGGDNIIIRYVTSRPGEKGTESDYDAWGGSAGSNSVIDHCSIGWANDEQFGLYSNNMNMTVQYSIIGPSNCVSYHSKGAHGFGMMFGKGQNSWHHNLVCHSLSRNFRGKVVGTNSMDFVNNVIYNWGYQTAYGTLGRINYVNNYLKTGPSTKGGRRFLAKSSGSNYENYKFYVSGNKLMNSDDTVYSEAIENDNWNGVDSKFDRETYESTVPFPVKASDGTDASVVYNAESAEDAYNHVLAYCGASVNPADNGADGYDYSADSTRNLIDAQVLYETRTGTGSLTGGRDFSTVTDSAVLSAIDTYGIKQVDYSTYYPAANKTKEITDSDNDGMPDEWELERGLNPNDAGDATGDYLGEGYNNIEYYINDLTVNSFPEGVVKVSATVTDLGNDYRFATEDANAISLTTSAISDASEIVLPTEGSLHGSSIEWISASSRVTIKNNVVTAINRPEIGNETVSLLAKVTSGEFTCSRYLTVKLRATSVVWTASEANNGAAAETKLANGLYNVSALTGGKTDVNINGNNYTYYCSGTDSGGWADGKATGTAFRYKASEDGFLTAYITSLGETKSAYIVSEGTEKYKTDYLASVSGADGANRAVTAQVEKGKTYYIFVSGSKGKFTSICFGKTAPVILWKASADISENGTLMSNLTANEAMTYTAKSNISINAESFTGCISGTTNPGDNGATGAALTYKPDSNGILTVYYKIGAGKTFKINDSEGNIVESYTNEDELSEYTSTFAELKKGKTYYLYAAGSKAEFYGASWVITASADIDDEDTSIKYVSVPSLSGTTVNAEVSNKSNEPATVYIAVYSKGILKQLYTENVPTKEDKSISVKTNKSDGDTVKVMLWNDKLTALESVFDL